MDQKQPGRQLTDEQRDLIFAVADCSQPVIYKLYEMFAACKVSMMLDFTSSLKWLVKNKITGQDFLTWFSEKQKGSVLQALSYIRKEHFNDVKCRPIYGKSISIN